MVSEKNEETPQGQSSATPPELTVQEVEELLRGGSSFRLIDVREDSEREIASIEGSEHLSQEAAMELFEKGDRDARYIFMCHHGIRSLAAAEAFAAKGFKNVGSMRGGIQAWSESIDPKIPTY